MPSHPPTAVVYSKSLCVQGIPATLDRDGNVVCWSDDGEECTPKYLSWRDKDLCNQVAEYLKPTYTYNACGCPHFEQRRTTGYEREDSWCSQAANKLGVVPQKACNTKWTCSQVDDGPLISIRLALDGNVECSSNDGRECATGEQLCNSLLNSYKQPAATVKCGCSLKASTGVTGYDTDGHWCSDSMAVLGANPPEKDFSCNQPVVFAAALENPVPNQAVTFAGLAFVVAGMALVALFVYRNRRAQSTNEERQQLVL
ncbi:Aste57867_4647 [Aphanomyces stellatus]|uniref:Aste57867_4647 protein n=1 Tax=Aphanomyces stellatus TaxID=120398 RepID=A0A485KDD8_9STRA|nr:hypothetical protein As57867_004634 [Aphanomyces stellatus]VFT81750.1 Aste57867_4647 [Aphanomyces stellatus]